MKIFLLAMFAYLTVSAWEWHRYNATDNWLLAHLETKQR